MRWVSPSPPSVVAAGLLLLLTVVRAPAADTAGPAPPVRSRSEAARPHETHVQISPAEAARQDREWLTAYMLVHQGYRLHHLEALNDTFSKMSPSQLGTLRKLYEEKHQKDMRGQDVELRMREQEAANAEAHNRMSQQQMNAFNTMDDQQGSATEQRLHSMHSEAFENYRMNMQQKTAYGRQRMFGGRYFW